MKKKRKKSVIHQLSEYIKYQMWIQMSKYEQFSSVQVLSCLRLSLWPHGLQHARLPCPTISFSVILFSSCLKSFIASGSFPMSQFFTSSGQTFGASALASVLPMNVQDWFPLGLTGLISSQSKGLSRVFSNTTVQKHQFLSAQLSLWFKSYIRMWLLEKA